LEDRTVPAILLNEIYVNPPVQADDNREYVEIINTSGGAIPLTDIWLLEIEGDSSTAKGVVDMARNLSSLSTGTNGLLMLGEGYGTTMTTPWGAMVDPATALGDLGRTPPTMENGGVTFMLVTNFTGTVGLDLDTNDDGVFDITPWTSILDSVGWKDGGAASNLIYTSAELLMIPSTSTPDAATRFPGNTKAHDAGAWYGGDVLANGLNVPDLGTSYDAGGKSTANAPIGSYITPGSHNYGPPVPPKLVAPPVIGDGTAQRSLVKSITVSFDQPVSFPDGYAAAFQVNRTGPAGPTGAVSLSFNQVGNDIVISFTTGGAVGIDPGNSLIDGKYEFTIVAEKIQSTNGTFDGNGNGLGETGGVDNVVVNFHRLFGDANGDQVVSATDFNAFRLVYGGGASIFDFDGDGQTSASDFNNFRLRYGIGFNP
jgi:hypothetical protein